MTSKWKKNTVREVALQRLAITITSLYDMMRESRTFLGEAILDSEAQKKADAVMICG